MSSIAATPQRRKPSREEALAIASQRKLARARRTLRIRKTVAALAVAAFLGPFAVIYTQSASGTDPGVSNASATTSASGSTSASTGGSGSTSANTSTSSPSPVTTQQS
jgi:hypothetical protein